MSEERMYRVRDPILGFIQYNEAERQIIDHPYFQRLRRIRQNSTTYLVYPGASHSRFEHSLGTMEMATRVFKRILERQWDGLKGEFQGADPEHLRRLLRVAALLHDIGHPPYLHTGERLFAQGMSHERITALVIQDPQFSNLIERILPTHFLASSVLDVISVAVNVQVDGVTSRPPLAFLKDVLQGDLGVDRIDYLLRDSLYAGVHYGQFDYARLIDTLCAIRCRHEQEDLTGEIRVGVDYPGLHAAEGMLLARYFMFLQVYHHETRRILDHHLAEFLKLVLPSGQWSSEVPEYMQHTDTQVDAVLWDSYNGLRGSDIQELAARVIGRHHFRQANYWRSTPDRRLGPTFKAQVAEVLAGKYNECNDFIIDEVKDEKRPQVKVRVRGDGIDADTRSILLESDLVSSLSSYHIVRVYTPNDPTLRAEVGAYSQEKIGNDFGGNPWKPTPDP